MHVYRARARSSISAYIRPSQSERGGRVYEIKTLRSNLAPEEGGGRLFEGGRIIEQVGMYNLHGVYYDPNDPGSYGYSCN